MFIDKRMAQKLANMSSFHSKCDYDSPSYKIEKDVIFHADAMNAVESRFGANFVIVLQDFRFSGFAGYVGYPPPYLNPFGLTRVFINMRWAFSGPHKTSVRQTPVG